MKLGILLITFTLSLCITAQKDTLTIFKVTYVSMTNSSVSFLICSSDSLIKYELNYEKNIFSKNQILFDYKSRKVKKTLNNPKPNKISVLLTQNSGYLRFESFNVIANIRKEAYQNSDFYYLESKKMKIESNFLSFAELNKLIKWYSR